MHEGSHQKSFHPFEKSEMLYDATACHNWVTASWQYPSCDSPRKVGGWGAIDVVVTMISLMARTWRLTFSERVLWQRGQGVIREMRAGGPIDYRFEKCKYWYPFANPPPFSISLCFSLIFCHIALVFHAQWYDFLHVWDNISIKLSCKLQFSIDMFQMLHSTPPPKKKKQQKSDGWGHDKNHWSLTLYLAKASKWDRCGSLWYLGNHSFQSPRLWRWWVSLA